MTVCIPTPLLCCYVLDGILLTVITIVRRDTSAGICEVLTLYNQGLTSSVAFRKGINVYVMYLVQY